MRPTTVHVGEPVIRAYQPQGATRSGSNNAALRFGMNLDLVSRGLTTGTGGEPSVAAAGNIMFYTENWRAGYSTDGGLSWTSIDPANDLPAAYGGFCCDQVVIYVKRVDRFVWLLQYAGDAANNAAIRMVIISPQQLRAGVAARNWRRFDFDSIVFDQRGLALDQADLAIGTNALYMTVDQMNAMGQVSKSHVVRIGIGQLLRTSMDVTYNTVDRPYLHAVQNVGRRAYFAQHLDTSTIRIYYWDEGTGNLVEKKVTHPTVPDQNWSSITPAPGGADWLNRTNNSGGYRIRGATLAGRVIWLAWSAARDATVDGKTKQLFKQPHIEIAKLTAGTLALDGQEYVANDNHAFARPVLATTAQGEVAMSFAWGGNKWYPSQGVAFLTGRREFWSSLESTSDGPGGAATNPHGDYATIRAGWPLSECLLTVAIGWQGTQEVSRLVTFDRRDNEAQCTPRPEFLEQSTLQLACPSGALTTNDAVAVQGSITPSRPGVTVTIIWQSPDGATVTHTVVTDPTSRFVDPGPPTRQGAWRVTAAWAGDSQYLSATAACSFSVSAPPPPGKLASAITMSCPPGFPNFTLQYTVIEFAGRIEPFHPNAAVTITYSLPGSSPISHTAATDGGGNYKDSFSFDIPGNWQIQAAWLGDSAYDGASSPVCPLEVAYKPR